MPLSVFKYFSRQISFSRTFQDSPVYFKYFSSLCKPCLTSYSMWNGLRTMGSSSTQLNCCKYGWARASSAVSLREGSNTSSFSRRSKAETAKAKYSKTCVKRPLSKRPEKGFQDQISLNAGQKYCRMLQGEHSAVLLTFIKLPFVIKIFALPILSGRFTQVLHRYYCTSMSWYPA